MFVQSLGVNVFRARRLLKITTLSEDIIKLCLVSKLGTNFYYNLTFSNNKDFQKRIIQEGNKRNIRISPVTVRRLLEKLDSDEYDINTLTKKNPYTEMISKSLAEGRKVNVDVRKLDYSDVAPRFRSAESISADLQLVVEAFTTFSINQEKYKDTEKRWLFEKVRSKIELLHQCLNRMNLVE